MDLDMERVLYRALKKSCAYIREDPPGGMDSWVQFWLDLAIKEIREEEKLNDIRKITKRNDYCNEK